MLDRPCVRLQTSEPTRDVEVPRPLHHPNRDRFLVPTSFDLCDFAELDGDRGVAGSSERDELSTEVEVVRFEGVDGRP
jgi:hypothetical protein